MNFPTQFTNFKQIFDDKISSFLESKIADGGQINQTAKDNLQDLLRLVEVGGKRVRPALVYFGFLAANGDENSPAAKGMWQLGMALELLHTFALVHDDIIDEALTRRGFPTMEARYRKLYAAKGMDPDRTRHFALSAAILGGDFAHMLADELVSTLPLESKLQTQISKMYYDMQFELIAGQIDDCLGIGLDSIEAVEEERIIRMLHCKSGGYSIQKPMLMGAALAELSEQKAETLRNIGEDMGILYQVTDDLLGMFGQEDELGKSVVSDILEGKRTLLAVRTYHRASDSEKKRILTILGNPQATPEDINWFKDMVQITGVRKEMETYCNQLKDRAQTNLHQHFDPQNPGVNFIYQLAQYLIDRKS